jgi:DNA-directed RNA polymerase subunit F
MVRITGLPVEVIRKSQTRRVIIVDIQPADRQELEKRLKQEKNRRMYDAIKRSTCMPLNRCP